MNFQLNLPQDDDVSETIIELKEEVQDLKKELRLKESRLDTLQKELKYRKPNTRLQPVNEDTEYFIVEELPGPRRPARRPY